MKKQFSGQSSLNKKNKAIALLMTVVFVASGFFISVPQSFAADNGFLAPNQTVASYSVDNPDYGWTSDNYQAIFSSDDDYSDYGFSDFNIPTGATINGIEVAVEGQREGLNSWLQTPRNLTVAIWNKSNGKLTSSQTAVLTTSDTVVTLGGATDKWGKTWVISDFSDADFKIRIRATSATQRKDAFLDQVRVKIHYTVPNTAPVANTDSYSIDENGVLSVSAPGVLSNDTDANSDPLTAILVSGASNGSLTLNSDGSLEYTPVADYFGSDSFTYKANDGKADSNVATVNITVNAINDAPVISSVSIAPADPKTNETLTASVIASDIDGGALSYTYSWKKNNEDVGDNSPALDLSISGNGDKTDSISVNVVADDGNGGTDTKSAEAVIVANTAPVAESNGLNVSEDGTVSFSLSASDDDNDSLNYIILDGPANGSLTGEAPELTYTPAENYNGADSFTFKVNDGTEDSNIATININVSSENDSPILAEIGDKEINETAELSFTASASDIEEDALQYYLSESAPEGASINSETGAFTWTPSEEQGGAAYTFDVNVSDGQNGIDSETITVTVNEINIPPVSSDLEITTDEDLALEIELSGSDSDVPANTLTYSILENPANGVIENFNAEAGTLTYVPNSNFHGSDMFLYTVSDGVLNSGTTTVYIGVRDIAPVVVSAIYTSPTTVKITFDEGLQNNEMHSPKIADFKIYRHIEGAEIAISEISYAEKVVTLTLSEAISAGDTPVYQVLPMLIASTIIDEAGNQITQIAQGDLIKEDKTAPLINLNGATEITLTVGDAYLEQGAAWIDDFDGIGTTTEISGTVDVNTVGVYEVRYNKTDESGNAAIEKIRTITVNAKPEGTPSPAADGGSVYRPTLCASVNYGEWGGCFSGYQYRDVLSQSPAFCALSPEQESARKKVCGNEESTLEDNSNSTQKVLGAKKYADGTLLRGSDKKVYIVIGGKLLHIINLKELAKYAGREIIDVDDSVIDSFSKITVLGVKKYGEGQLIRNDNVKVYVINKDLKKHILNLEELAKYYFGRVINHVSALDLLLY